MPSLYARMNGLGFQEAQSYVLRQYEQIGFNDIRWYQPDYWFSRLGLQGDPLQIFRENSDKIKFYPEVPTVLKTLSRRYGLVITSGIPRELVEISIEKYISYFKRVFSPISDLKETRKTTNFYAMICKVLGIEPSEIVHIGNNRIFDFQIPQKIGIKSFLLDRTGENAGDSVLRDLEELEGRLPSEIV
jgi:putative hydrolase of the HAD superfamily